MAVILAAGALAPQPATARSSELKAKAQALAADVAALDQKIDAAVQRNAQATQALVAVRDQLRDNRRMQKLSRHELQIARATLAARAVAMYKHEDVTALDALFTAEDFGALVRDLSLVQHVAHSDGDVVHTIERSERDLANAAVKLAADERTAKRLVGQRAAELQSIRGQLAQRRALLAGVRSEIRRAAAKTKTTPSPGATVEPPSGSGGGSAGGGSGPWWPLIQSAAGSQGVSARGMYRLMMIESGGSASIVGPGGYYGLFQYAPSTWKGSWNPWRSSSITDGSAQIKATALAIAKGYGHAWWDPSYTWAFQGQ